IRDHPEVDDHRLVYADWLEERGDRRAEYLRVEHAVRVRGARLRPRLEALRSQLDPGWLEAVHDRKLGPDWAIVLQSYNPPQRLGVLARIREIAGLGDAQAAAALRACPHEVKRGLRYSDAHRLRAGFGSSALVTVEFRPSEAT